MGRSLIVFAACLLSLTHGWQWDEPSTKGSSGPGPRKGHSVTLVNAQAANPKIVICAGIDDTLFATDACSVLNPFGWSFDSSFKLSKARNDHVALVVRSGGVEYLVLSGGTLNKTDTCDILTTTDLAPAPGAACSGSFPDATWGATLSRSANGQTVLFGGATGSFAAPGADQSGTYVLDTAGLPASLVWKPAPMTADPAPPARHYHAAATWGNMIGVYGGITVGGQVLNDLWLLDTTATSWIWIPAKVATTAAPALYGHQAIVVNGLFLLFGGNNPTSSELYSSAVGADSAATWSFTSPPAGGNSPNAILRSALTVLDADGDSDPDLVIYGGSASSGTAPASELSVLSDIGLEPRGVGENIALVAGGAGGALALMVCLAVCAWRRQRRPKGLAQQLAVMATRPFDTSSSYESDDGAGDRPSSSSYGATAIAASSQGGSYQSGAASRTPSRATSAGYGRLGKEPSSKTPLSSSGSSAGQGAGGAHGGSGRVGAGDSGQDEEDEEEEGNEEARLRF